MLSYWRYCRDVHRVTRRTSRADDFASELLAAHRRPTPSELTLPRGRVGHLRTLVRRPRSGDRAASATACCACCPAGHSGTSCARDPSLIANAVEEVLRFESSQVSWRRVHDARHRARRCPPAEGHAAVAELRRREPSARPVRRTRRRSTSIAPNADAPHLVRQGHPLLPRRQPGQARTAHRAAGADPAGSLAPALAPTRRSCTSPTSRSAAPTGCSSNGRTPNEPVPGAEVPVSDEPRPPPAGGVPRRPGGGDRRFRSDRRGAPSVDRGRHRPAVPLRRERPDPHALRRARTASSGADYLQLDARRRRHSTDPCERASTR